MPSPSPLRSFSYAVAGMMDLIRSQRTARIHLGVTLVLIPLVRWLALSRIEIALVALAMASVWSAEAANTAIEFLGDRITREHDPLIGRAKDVAAAAVLLAAIGAAIVGVCILGPALLGKFAVR